MAAPHVAGAWAILKQAVPSLSVTESLNALQSTGAPVVPKGSPCPGNYSQRRIRINSALDSLGAGGCGGQMVTVHNIGQGTLEVDAISAPSWVRSTPAPPFEIPGGGNREMCVTVDCNACDGSDLSGSVTIQSNDPDSPTLNVPITVNCGGLPAPSNDTCADAMTIMAGVTSFSNEMATADGPNHCGGIGSDIWYNHTATCTGTMTIDTCGSEFDTVLNVYESFGCQGTSVDCNDDACDLQSRVQIGVTTGEPIKIQVGGYQGEQGTGVINISCGAICGFNGCEPGEDPCNCPDDCPGCCSDSDCPGDECWYGVCNAGTCGADNTSFGTPCGDSGSSACDLPDTCDGFGTCVDRVKPVGTTCRPASGECDFAETCNGSSSTCPVDVVRPNGTPCPNGMFCDGDEACDSTGNCLTGARPCNDGDGTGCPPTGTGVEQCSEGDLGAVCTSCPCPDGTSMRFTQPTSPMTDAGQPHPIDDSGTAQGYSVFQATGPSSAADVACWSLSETDAGACGNFITGVVENPPSSGNYEITLDHPLEPGAITTITYSWGDGSTAGVFKALPGDVDSNGETNTADISALIGCLSTGACEVWQCDIDRLGGCTGADLGRMIDLLNNAGQFNGWNGATTVSTPCPPP